MHIMEHGGGRLIKSIVVLHIASKGDFV